MKKFRPFKFPNPLICDDALSYSARRVRAAPYGHRNQFAESRAVAALKGLRGMLVLACVKVNHAFGRNSYHFVVNAVHGFQRVLTGLKASFLCLNSTAAGHQKQSEFSIPGVSLFGNYFGT